MLTQTNPNEAIPQGDGADRPFRGQLVGAHHIGTLTDLDPLATYEDYRIGQQPDAADMLVQSLQSQALKTAGEVLNAIERACFLDLVKAWRRLLKVAGVTVPVVRSFDDWTFDRLRFDVTIALCHAENVDHPIGLGKWARIDALLRGEAMRRAMAMESRTETSQVEQENAAVYRAFAEGRSL